MTKYCGDCKHEAAFECGLSYNHIHKKVKDKWIEVPVQVVNPQSWAANKNGDCPFYNRRGSESKNLGVV